MAYRVASVEFYESLLAAFRAKPGNWSHAAAHAGCDRRTATRWWEAGQPPHYKPIKQVLAEEQEEIRHQQQELREIELQEREALKDAKRKAEEERDTQEVNIMKLARSNVLGSAMALAHPNASMRRVCEAMAASIDKLATDIKVDPGSVKPERVMALANAYARAVKAVTEASRLIVVAERVRRGEEVQGDLGLSVSKMTTEAALEVIELANEAAARAKRNGLVAIDGGKGKTG